MNRLFLIIYNDFVLKTFRNLDNAIEFIKTRKNCRIEEVNYE